MLPAHLPATQEKALATQQENPIEGIVEPKTMLVVYCFRMIPISRC